MAPDRRGRAERLLAGLEFTAVDRLLRPFVVGAGVIFALHRVAPPGAALLDPDTMIDADLLDRTVTLIRQHGFDCVSLDEIPERLRARARTRFACLTFDDGYRDNLHVALPVLESHGVPFCVNVTTGFIDRTAPYWWGALARAVIAADTLAFDAMGPTGTVATRTWQEKQAAYARIESWVHTEPDTREAVALKWTEAQGISCREALDADALTWDEVRQLASHPLVTIGAHAVTHRRLSRCDDETLQRELVASRERLERETGRSVRHLAYPFGGPSACGEREYHAAAAVGFTTAVTSRRGHLFRAHATRLTALPRQRISGRATLVDASRALHGTDWLLRRGPRAVVQ